MTQAASAVREPAARAREDAPRRRRGGPGPGLLLGYALLGLFAVVYIYPFLIQLVTSFKTAPDSVADPLSLVPDPFTTQWFERLGETEFTLWFANSAIVAVVVTVGRVFFDSLAGYALSRLEFPGRGLLFTGILAVMAVPPVVLLIPKFLVLNQLGIYDTYAALAVPLIADAAGIFIMKQFFQSLPRSIEEAARIDGAGTFRVFWSIALPMAKPALITLTILSFQGSWNELPHYLVAAQDPELNTLTKGVATLVTGQLGSGQQYPLTMAASLLMTIPVAIVFVFFQRYFVRGANTGAEKG